MRVTRLFLAVVMVLVCGSLTAQLRADDAPASQLLKTLLSPDTSDEQWHKAEDSFRKLPADVAIRALFPEIAKGSSDAKFPIKYNCSDPNIDRHREVFGRYCVVSWLWCKTLACARGESKAGKTLLELWAQPQSIYGQSALLSALDSFHWVPEAEEPVGELFMDLQADSKLRAEAAACLLHHFGTKYQHDVIVFAQFSSREIQDFLFRQLVSPPYTRVSGVDAAVVRMGFWLMFDGLAKNEERFAQPSIGGSYYGAFLRADALGMYLNEPFTPDYKLRKYQGEQGRELWYRETSENALTWWLKNRERYAN